MNNLVIDFMNDLVSDFMNNLVSDFMNNLVNIMSWAILPYKPKLDNSNPWPPQVTPAGVLWVRPDPTRFVT